MKKLISMLCIATVSITFSYTDIAEARSYDSEEAFLDNNTRNNYKKSGNRKVEKQKKQKKQRKNKKRKGNRNVIASNSQDEMRGDEDSEENIQRKPFKQKKNKKRRTSKKNKNNKRNVNTLNTQNREIYDEYDEDNFRVRNNNFQQNRNDDFKQKNNKKRRRNKKNKQSRRNRGRQEEVLYNDAQYNMRSGNDMHKQGKNNDDWKNVPALTNDKGQVMNPKVNSSIFTEKSKTKEEKLRITKGLTPHIALGTDTEQLIQPKHNNKRSLKEPIQLRQELERYRKMFAQVPISDETA